MEQLKNKAKNKFSQLKFTDRQIIEQLIKKLPTKAIANVLQKDRTTIERELKLGQVLITNTVHDVIAIEANLKREYKQRWVYSAEVAQQKRDINATAKGCREKLADNHKFAKEVARLIKQGYSPYATLQIIKRCNPEIYLDISVKTLYNYIDADYIPNITNKDLWCKKLPKKVKHKKVRSAYNNVKGLSIDNRPKEADERTEFGHWEIDLVVGKQGSKTVMLTLSERMTRYEIIVRLPNKKQKTIAKALDSIEKRYGKYFSKVFLSITCDNGSEFLDSRLLEKSCRNKGKRTTVYYAHPYSSWERGTNEVGNKFIRRFVKKGLDIAQTTSKKIQEVAQWINNYPRKVLSDMTASYLYEQQLAIIKQK